MPLSVAIITFNAARTFENTLISLPAESQIVVLDSGSTDNTKTICQKYKVEFYQKKWTGFAPQRNAATKFCIHPWVLYLDADEWLSPALRDEITLVAKSNLFSRGYKMRRVSCLENKFIKHGDWACDFVTRLVPRDSARWIGDEPHPYIDEKNLEIITLKHPLLHDPYADIQEYEKKIRTYARIWASNEYERGKKTTSPVVASLRAAWRWFRGYILRAGFLDGKQGWLVAAMSAKIVIYKHKELQDLSKHTHSRTCSTPPCAGRT
jgi:glycosyltransferase involved in cell wall biosynthesis